MRTTKQKRKYAITLPKEAVDVLRWHVNTQLATPEQEESDLLLPAVNGRFRSPSVLNKPLDEVAVELHLGKKITQRALRRTSTTSRVPRKLTTSSRGPSAVTSPSAWSSTARR